MHFSSEQLTNTAHDYELIPLKETVLNIDYAESGSGSNFLPDLIRNTS